MGIPRITVMARDTSASSMTACAWRRSGAAHDAQLGSGAMSDTVHCSDQLLSKRKVLRRAGWTSGRLARELGGPDEVESRPGGVAKMYSLQRVEAAEAAWETPDRPSDVSASAISGTVGKRKKRRKRRKRIAPDVEDAMHDSMIGPVQRRHQRRRTRSSDILAIRAEPTRLDRHTYPRSSRRTTLVGTKPEISEQRVAYEIVGQAACRSVRTDFRVA